MSLGNSISTTIEYESDPFQDDVSIESQSYDFQAQELSPDSSIYHMEFLETWEELEESEDTEKVEEAEDLIDFDLSATETEFKPKLSPKKRISKKLFLGTKINKKYKTRIHKTLDIPRETLIQTLESFLNELQECINSSEIPTLVLWSRLNTNALEYKNNSIQMNASRMKKKSICFGNSRFEMFISVIQDISTSLKQNITCTKRDIYYKNVDLYKNQSKVDVIIEDIACSLGVSRRALNIIAGSKGLFAGSLTLQLLDGSLLDGEQAGEQGLLIPAFEDIQELSTTASIILVIEKEATFTKLLNLKFLDLFHGQDVVLFTGKGYPDVATRQLLSCLQYKENVKQILMLTDADPHGFCIYLTYKYGSKSMAFDSHNLTVSKLIFLGLKPSLWGVLNLHSRLISLKLTDVKKAHSLLQHPMISLEPELIKELSILLKMNKKMELQNLEEFLFECIFCHV